MKLTIENSTYRDNKKHKCGMPRCQSLARYKVVADKAFTKIIYKVCKRHCREFTKWEKQWEESFKDAWNG